MQTRFIVLLLIFWFSPITAQTNGTMILNDNRINENPVVITGQSSVQYPLDAKQINSVKAHNELFTTIQFPSNISIVKIIHSRLLAVKQSNNLVLIRPRLAQSKNSLVVIDENFQSYSFIIDYDREPHLLVVMNEPLKTLEIAQETTNQFVVNDDSSRSKNEAN